MTPAQVFSELGILTKAIGEVMASDIDLGVKMEKLNEITHALDLLDGVVERMPDDCTPDQDINTEFDVGTWIAPESEPDFKYIRDRLTPLEEIAASVGCTKAGAAYYENRGMQKFAEALHQRGYAKSSDLLPPTRTIFIKG